LGGGFVRKTHEADDSAVSDQDGERFRQPLELPMGFGQAPASVFTCTHFPFIRRSIHDYEEALFCSLATSDARGHNVAASF
jgi:glutamate racemase